MSKATATRLGRMFEGDTKRNIWRKEKIDPPQDRKPVLIRIGGIEFYEWLAPGQIINSHKAYKREMKRREEMRKNNRSFLAGLNKKTTMDSQENKTEETTTTPETGTETQTNEPKEETPVASEGTV